MALSIIYRSNGESSLRAYVACAVPRFPAPPVEAEARVVLVDPRLAATAKRGPRDVEPAQRGRERMAAAQDAGRADARRTALAQGAALHHRSRPDGAVGRGSEEETGMSAS